MSNGNTNPLLTISSSRISSGLSTGFNTVTDVNQCISSSATNVQFAFNTAKNPATYTFKFTCTLMMNGSAQSVVSSVQDGSGACEQSQSDVACQNAATGNADKHCSSMCASYR